MNMKLFVIVGLQRTGTTLLASMLGRHPEINMLFESVTMDSLQLLGKDWRGNKLLAYRQIRMHQRSSKFGHLINRIVNLDFMRKNKHHLLRPFPTSKMSIEDYQKEGAVFITIEREKDAAVRSMMKRAGQSLVQASKEFDKGMMIINKLKQQDNTCSVTFLDLVNNPEKVIKKISDFLKIEYLDKMIKEGPRYNIVYPKENIDKKDS